jgi:hypothetical protein
MTSVPSRAYAESQIKKIGEKIAKLDAKDKATPARKARLVSASKKWMRLAHRGK